MSTIPMLNYYHYLLDCKLHLLSFTTRKCTLNLLHFISIQGLPHFILSWLIKLFYNGLSLCNDWNFNFDIT